MSWILLPLILSVLTCAASTAVAQESRFIQMETEEAYILMDDEGVAYRYAKNWACRHSGWGTGDEPEVLGYSEFIALRDRSKADGSWELWTCAVRPGPITFSRDLQRAQRRMNSNVPFGAPYVPETGRYSAEMLEYNRISLDAALFAARTDYQVAFVTQLSALLREAPPTAVTRDNAWQILTALTAKATAKKLDRPFEMCGRMVDNVFDYVDCRMTARDSALKKAEEKFAEFQDRLRNLRGQTIITPETLAQMGEDAILIDKFIRQAKREGDAAVGTVPVE